MSGVPLLNIFSFCHSFSLLFLSHWVKGLTKGQLLPMVETHNRNGSHNECFQPDLYMIFDYVWCHKRNAYCVKKKKSKTPSFKRSIRFVWAPKPLRFSFFLIFTFSIRSLSISLSLSPSLSISFSLFLSFSLSFFTATFRSNVKGIIFSPFFFLTGKPPYVSSEKSFVDRKRSLPFLFLSLSLSLSLSFCLSLSLSLSL